MAFFIVVLVIVVFVVGMGAINWHFYGNWEKKARPNWERARAKRKARRELRERERREREQQDE